MNSIPIKIAFLWHFHQPDYSIDNNALLPWVRLHSTKDYFDFPAILHSYPKIKMNFNIVPSLLTQINKYIDNSLSDRQLVLSKISPSDLTNEMKKEILLTFFMANEKNCIIKYSRYYELFLKSKSSNAIFEFTNQDWIDLQVYFNFSWIGEYSKNEGICRRIIAKKENFTILERDELLNFQSKIMSSIIPQLIKLQQLGQIELSVSPLNHPILPLLCNNEFTSNNNHNIFEYKIDADTQISKAKQVFKENFKNEVCGIWSSEGSLSNDVLDLFIKNNFKWTASDEDLLAQSISNYKKNDKYFVYRYNNTINIIFRDKTLSDKIGFEYSGIPEEIAVRDFICYLHNIKSDIINEFGDKALDDCVITIILDGENCWEYYPENGKKFLQLLFEELSHPDFETILMSEIGNINAVELNSIHSGSWINANFDIWTKSNENQNAWYFLLKARQALESKINTIPEKVFLNAYDNILAAESSDWFWWYHSEHHSFTEPIFDFLFRKRLAKVYELIDEEIPQYLLEPNHKNISNINDLDTANNSTMHKTT